MKWQRNQIFKAIQAVGLNPIEFALDSAAAETTIKHKRSASCFTIGSGHGHYDTDYVIGDGPNWPLRVYSWQTVIPRISRWLEDVKRDLETPDLWAELQRDAQLLLGATSDLDTENTPFTPDEQNKITTQLHDLAERARHKYSLSVAQLRDLNAKLDYLVNATRRFGRKDWLMVCAGVFLTLIVEAALPQEVGRGMLQGLLRAIGHHYGLPELPDLPC
jgi:hypothetical protein